MTIFSQLLCFQAMAEVVLACRIKRSVALEPEEQQKVVTEPPSDELYVPPVEVGES